MMNASECETRFLASSRIRAGSGFIFFSFFFFLSSSRSPTPAFFFFGHMPTTHVLSCHSGSFTLLPSLKCNYCWWRSNASCVTDNQTGAKSIWLNWLRINCGTGISRRSGFNCAISSLSVEATHFNWSEDSRCHTHPGCPLFTLSVGLHAKRGGNDTLLIFGRQACRWMASARHFAWNKLAKARDPGAPAAIQAALVTRQLN